jgi:hypothetical protein
MRSWLRLRVIADPTNPADTINNEAVTQKQIDVYPASETVIATTSAWQGRSPMALVLRAFTI